VPATGSTHGLPDRWNDDLLRLQVNFSSQVHSSGTCPGFVVNGQAEAAPAFEGGTDEPVGEQRSEAVGFVFPL
jgi:hypothetical protein